MPKRKTQDQFVYELSLVSPNIKVVGDYQNNHTNIEVSCNICNHSWNPTPHNLLDSLSGCPKCSGKRNKTTIDFADELRSIDSTLHVIGEYINSKEPIDIRCLVCGHEWSPIPNNVLRGSGCPECNTSGFKKSEIATFYIYEFRDAYGFGVTNSMWDRDRTHRRNFKKHNKEGWLISTIMGQGSYVLEFEKHVRRTLPTINLGIEGFKREGLPKDQIACLFAMIAKSNLIQSLTLTTTKTSDTLLLCY